MITKPIILILCILILCILIISDKKINNLLVYNKESFDIKRKDIIYKNSDKDFEIKLTGNTHGNLIFKSSSVKKDAIKFEATDGGIDIDSDLGIDINCESRIDINCNDIILKSPDKINITANKFQLNSSSVSFITKSFIVEGDNTIRMNSNDVNTPALLKFEKIRSNSGVVGDDIGKLEFYGDNTLNIQTLYGQILCEVADATAGSEDGKISLGISHNGNMQNYITISNQPEIIDIGVTDHFPIYCKGDVFLFDTKINGSNENNYINFDTNSLLIKGDLNIYKDLKFEGNSNDNYLKWELDNTRLVLAGSSSIHFSKSPNSESGHSLSTITLQDGSNIDGLEAKSWGRIFLNGSSYNSSFKVYASEQIKFLSYGNTFTGIDEVIINTNSFTTAWGGTDINPVTNQTISPHYITGTEHVGLSIQQKPDIGVHIRLKQITPSVVHCVYLQQNDLRIGKIFKNNVELGDGVWTSAELSFHTAEDAFVANGGYGVTAYIDEYKTVTTDMCGRITVVIRDGGTVSSDFNVANFVEEDPLAPYHGQDVNIPTQPFMSKRVYHGALDCIVAFTQPYEYIPNVFITENSSVDKHFPTQLIAVSRLGFRTITQWTGSGVIVYPFDININYLIVERSIII